MGWRLIWCIIQYALLFIYVSIKILKIDVDRKTKNDKSQKEEILRRQKLDRILY